MHVYVRIIRQIHGTTLYAFVCGPIANSFTYLFLLYAVRVVSQPVSRLWMVASLIKIQACGV
jgi:hypothetical protein